MLGAVERLFTIVVQISLAVIVVQGFIRKQKRWLWLAIGYHALIDAVAVFATSKLSPYWVEGIVGIICTDQPGHHFYPAKSRTSGSK